MEADTEDKVSPVDSLVSVVVSVIRLDCEESLFNPWLVVIVDKLFKLIFNYLMTDWLVLKIEPNRIQIFRSDRISENFLKVA